MKPFELAVQNLPQTAGKAEICWTTEEPIRREGNKIILRLEDQMEFVPMMQGDQFVCCYPRTNHDNLKIWFGGTDENPFLTELSASDDTIKQGVSELLKSGDETSFYNALRPVGLDRLEDIFQVQARRQGDIFALPTPWKLSELEKLARLLVFEIVSNKAKQEETRILGTRHVIRGRVAEVTIFRKGNMSSYRSQQQHDDTILATGILEAPDHNPVKLTNLHALFQAGGLRDPQRAD